MVQKIIEMSTEIIDSPDEIIKHLHLGMSIPTDPEFHKYILREIELFNAKSIILKNNGEIIGNVLVYNDGSDILFFGYFGIEDHNPGAIGFLMNELIKYGKDNGYAKVRGPINIPTVIYGWGFMKEGCNEKLFVCCPVNPPIYQEIFSNNGFYLKFEEDRYKMMVYRYNPHKDPKYDFSDYEYYNPKDKEDLLRLKDEFIRLHHTYMPDSARITPNTAGIFENHANFILDYGANFMI
ncbi:hypothetical protein ES705_49241 [subsurface metagenome]